MIAGALVAVGVALLVVGSVAAVWAHLRAALAVQALGAALVGLGGLVALLAGEKAGASFSSGLTPSLGLDGLSGVFLAVLGAVAAPAVLQAVGFGAGRRERAIAALTGVFVVVLALVVCARDVVTFLAGWELMTLLPAAIILVARNDEAARRTVFAYVAITHLGGIGVWVALLELARLDAIGRPEALAAEGGATVAVVALAALVGFGTKAGLAPFHAWLPRTHPIAPPHVSALMSGVMLKVALYGLVRVLFEWSPPLAPWLGGLVVAVGALSAVGGALYAAFAGELKRLLAWSSVENVGVIVLGLGAALLLRRAGDETWAALALGGALLHVVNHALFKGLLFLGAGSLTRAVGSLELDRLGGLLTAMPRTGWALVVGALALAGVPPLNGFASEWVTLQGLLHLASPGRIGTGTVGVAGLLALAMTAGLAVLGVVRLVGLVLLGPPRTADVAAARDPAPTAWIGTAFLAAACVVLGLAPGLILPELAGLAAGAPHLERTPGLDLPATGTLPSAALAVALLVATGALLAARGRVAAPAPTWACGQPLDRGLLWTSAGFTKPLRLMGEAVLRPERDIAVERTGGVVRRVSYRGSVPHHVENVLYVPVRRAALAAASRARGLQTGRLGTYVTYLVGLVVALLGAARLGLLG